MNFDGSPADRSLLGRMKDAIAHRGPDGEGEFISQGVALGHRRLSIIDVGGGAQPISNEDDSIQIVFNGEIYNYVELREELLKSGHVFKTNSDTEVIIHGYEQWGLDCVSRFNGMFAFALWDERKKQLFIARDHLGIKPLYYVELGKRLLFASEIKSLLADRECPKAVDINSLGQLFTLRYVASPDTMFERIKKIPPGHWMLATAKGIKIERFWKWTPKIRTGVPESELVKTYQDLLEDAVRLQMRSDVPVGLFLSAGVDSGALLALMSKSGGNPVHTFTIGFEEGEKSNETDDARLAAKRFGADHSEMIVGPKEYQDYYERYLWDLEEPVGNESAAAFYFVSLIARKKVKVALTGQGADEPWAGYPRHIGAKLSSLYSRLPSLLTGNILTPLVSRFAKDERLRRGVLSLSEADPLQRFVKVYSFYSAAQKQRLYQPWLQEQLSLDGQEARKALARLYGDVAGLDPLTQMLYMDTRANLPDDLLMVGDKTSMANSLEARVPFLDHRLVEFVETLPPNMKLRGLQAKYLHKKAMEKWLPKEMIYQKKKGFANPIDLWLRGRMRPYIEECLFSDNARVRRYFSAGYMKELVQDHEAGKQHNLRHIYLLMSFEMWHRRFIDG
jgi:asparagine synthase (glutamine-hydrolysing)